MEEFMGFCIVSEQITVDGLTGKPKQLSGVLYLNDP